MNNKRKDVVGFWYDVRDVSGSHAEVTVGIAGLALALLLIIPIFGSGELSLVSKSEIVNAMLFFFFALGFGILASFTYSVLSGDVRDESDRLLSFLGPSVAFGVSVPTLFLGFLYVVIAYMPIESSLSFALSAMRLFSAMSLWASAVLVTRTIVEAVIFARHTSGDDSNRQQPRPWFERKITVILAFVYFVLLSIMVAIPESWQPFRHVVDFYFYYLVLLALLSVFYYAIATFTGSIGVSSTNKTAEPTRAYIVKMAYILLVGFAIFVLWTSVLFL